MWPTSRAGQRLAAGAAAASRGSRPGCHATSLASHKPGDWPGYRGGSGFRGGSGRSRSPRCSTTDRSSTLISGITDKKGKRTRLACRDTGVQHTRPDHTPGQVPSAGPDHGRRLLAGTATHPEEASWPDPQLSGRSRASGGHRRRVHRVRAARHRSETAVSAHGEVVKPRFQYPRAAGRGSLAHREAAALTAAPQPRARQRRRPRVAAAAASAGCGPHASNRTMRSPALSSHRPHQPHAARQPMAAAS